MSGTRTSGTRTFGTRPSATRKSPFALANDFNKLKIFNDALIKQNQLLNKENDALIKQNQLLNEQNEMTTDLYIKLYKFLFVYIDVTMNEMKTPDYISQDLKKMIKSKFYIEEIN